MIDSIINRLIKRSLPINIVSSQKRKIFTRHCFLAQDEYWIDNVLCYKLPWYLPFNAFIHEWENNVKDPLMHSHPRWSITIVLKGSIRERTPKYDRMLTPGSIVIRTHKAIHQFFTNDKSNCITLFIVGRRKYTQYDYDEVGNKVGLS